MSLGGSKLVPPQRCSFVLINAFAKAVNFTHTGSHADA
jgi:hypothetical protein